MGNVAEKVAEIKHGYTLYQHRGMMWVVRPDGKPIYCGDYYGYDDTARKTLDPYLDAMVDEDEDRQSRS